MSENADWEPKDEDSGVSIQNRRTDERKRVSLAVTLTSESNLYVGFADNMSEGGLFVATHELIGIGKQVDLEVQLPGEEKPIRVSGEVRWQRTVADPSNGVLPGFGAEFVDLSPEDRQRLEQFLEQREPIFHPE